MKNIGLILLFSGLTVGSFFAQSSTGVLVEKTYTEIGKVSDFKFSVMNVQDVSSKSIEKKLVIETKGSLTSDSRYVILSKNDLEMFINNMDHIMGEFNSTKKGTTEISFMASDGFEVGGVFETIESKAATPGKTKNIKVYVETMDKYYEGKLVNYDGNGKYIWKTVDASEVESGKEPVGKWVPFIRFVNTSSRSTSNLTVEEFGSMKTFLQDAKAKL